MREFKFRIWHFDREEFDYGGLWMFSNLFFPLRGCTVQQYTGLKDSVGKEIYEGHILSVPDFPNMEVEYCEDRAGYIGTWPNNKTPRRYPVEDLDCDFVDNAEIIGNIFQNPDLLK